MPRPERLLKLMTLLQTHAGMAPAALAKACGVSGRTLRRDLDALTRAGFPAYFDHGYRLAAPALLPAFTLTVDEALALQMAAKTAAGRAQGATARALALATERLQHILAGRPPEGSPDRQLSLDLPLRDSRSDAIMAALTTAIAERRSVKLSFLQAGRRPMQPRRVDPYQLIPSDPGWWLLAYCHGRRRILRIPVAQLREAVVMRRRFRPAPARLLARHLHRGPETLPPATRVRLECRAPLARTLRQHPPIGTLTIEDGPDGSTLFTLMALRTEDLIPWILSCGSAVEVLEPVSLRQEIRRTAQAIANSHG
jgi:predicted DNA-binding transcriptional regulator YafY